MKESRALSTPSICHFMREYARPTETFVVNQVAALNSLDQSVLCREHTKNIPSSTLESCTIPVHEFRGSRAPRRALVRVKPFSASEGIFYKRSVRILRPDVIHGHYGTDTAYLLHSIGRLSVPLVVSYYGYDVSRFPARFCGLARFYLRPVFRRAALHLAMTPDMASALVSLGAPEERVRVHHHGIDIRAWKDTDRRLHAGTRLLIVASLVEKKGHEVLLEAIALLARAHADVSLRIVGAGPLHSHLESLCSSLGIRDQVEFVGYLPHGERLAAEYADADIFVHPSRVDHRGDAEGLPGTILEAMASGLPVVSTVHAGIPYAVEHERTGLLVPEGDAVLLSQAIHRLLESRDERLTMGAAGRSRVVSDFDVVVQADRLIHLYTEAIADCE